VQATVKNACRRFAPCLRQRNVVLRLGRAAAQFTAPAQEAAKKGASFTTSWRSFWSLSAAAGHPAADPLAKPFFSVRIAALVIRLA